MRTALVFQRFPGKWLLAWGGLSPSCRQPSRTSQRPGGFSFRRKCFLEFLLLDLFLSRCTPSSFLKVLCELFLLWNNRSFAHHTGNGYFLLKKRLFWISFLFVSGSIPLMSMKSFLLNNCHKVVVLVCLLVKTRWQHTVSQTSTVPFLSRRGCCAICHLHDTRQESWHPQAACEIQAWALLTALVKESWREVNDSYIH